MDTAKKTKNRIRWLDLPLSLLLITIIFLITTCGNPRPSDEDWQNPARCLWITVESFPPGAQVYGVVDNQPRTLFGETPLTVKFFKGYRTKKEPIFWQCDKPEKVREELLENSYIEPTYFSSSKRKRVLSGMTTEWIHFHCLVVKEGYEPHLVEDWFKDETGVNDVPNAFKGKKTYTARLVPIQQAGELADFEQAE